MMGGMSGEMLRVLVVDDHRIVREGLRAYLSLMDDIEMVDEAADGRAALDALARAKAGCGLPDVVLMDLLMEPMDGVAATAAIKERYPEVEVVAVTSYVEEEKVHAALEAGAAGYLLKDAEADEIAAAIRSAQRGEVHLDPAVARQLTASLRRGPTADPKDLLTDREREILLLVARGQANKVIAAELVISERTARTHVSNILSKLGLTSRTQAALWAVREGLAHSPT
jgi:DNA-binding NarL/FixJ family response regulator